jgi:hypothetical protein
VTLSYRGWLINSTRFYRQTVNSSILYCLQRRLCDILLCSYKLSVSCLFAEARAELQLASHGELELMPRPEPSILVLRSSTTHGLISSSVLKFVSVGSDHGVYRRPRYSNRPFTRDLVIRRSACCRFNELQIFPCWYQINNKSKTPHGRA